jgi:hypothetical protein
MRHVAREELEGVIAHELAHIKNRDMLLQTVTATLAGAISYLAYWRMFFGGATRRAATRGPPRDDDPRADGGGAHPDGHQPPARVQGGRGGGGDLREPEALAGALLRQALEAYAQRIPMQVSPAAAPLAQVNPLSAAHGGGVAKLFSTHPPTEERVPSAARSASRGGGRTASPRAAATARAARTVRAPSGPWSRTLRCTPAHGGRTAPSAAEAARARAWRRISPSSCCRPAGRRSGSRPPALRPRCARR